jgi:hypothetical protein
VNFYFEPGPRVDHPTNPVIDPAVICFDGLWHYLSPMGTPQEGAYHYISPDGMDFEAVPNIPSDPQHNWTGNYVANTNDELRFYGTGRPRVWFNSSPNGGEWTGYTNTNILGGDPTVVRRSLGSYLMVYVGTPYLPAGEPPIQPSGFRLFPSFPNPFNAVTTIHYDLPNTDHVSLRVFNLLGGEVAVLKEGLVEAGNHYVTFDGASLASGIYLARLEVESLSQTNRMLLLK